MNLEESQPDLTLTIPKAVGQMTAKGNQSGKSGRVLTEYALRKKQLKAKLLWALKSVMSHFSYNSSADIFDIVRAMFLDRAIAQKHYLT